MTVEVRAIIMRSLSSRHRNTCSCFRCYIPGRCPAKSFVIEGRKTVSYHTSYYMCADVEGITLRISALFFNWAIKAFICAVMDTMSLSFLCSCFYSFLLDHHLRHHMLSLCYTIWLQITQACGFHTCFLDFHRIGSRGCWGGGVLVERRDIFCLFMIFWIIDSILSYIPGDESPR